MNNYLTHAWGAALLMVSFLFAAEVSAEEPKTTVTSFSMSLHLEDHWTARRSLDFLLVGNVHAVETRDGKEDRTFVLTGDKGLYMFDEIVTDLRHAPAPQPVMHKHGSMAHSVPAALDVLFGQPTIRSFIDRQQLEVGRSGLDIYVSVSVEPNHIVARAVREDGKAMGQTSLTMTGHGASVSKDWGYVADDETQNGETILKLMGEALGTSGHEMITYTIDNNPALSTHDVLTLDAWVPHKGDYAVYSNN